MDDAPTKADGQQQQGGLLEEDREAGRRRKEVANLALDLLTRSTADPIRVPADCFSAAEEYFRLRDAHLATGDWSNA